MKVSAIILALFLAANARIFSSNLTIKVTDGAITLEDASVSIAELKISQLTDDRGVCVFKNLTDGAYTIYAILPGYEKYSNTIEIKGADQDIGIRLKKTVYSLGEINVESKRNKGKADTETTLKKEELKENSQTLMNDSFKTLQLMPGVSSGGSADDSRMYIQGGDNSEWIANMDGVFIANPTRWGGPDTVSMFNPYLVDSIDLYTAGYPPMYGQGLSGVIVVDTINGSKDRWKGFFDVSFISAEMLVEGPIASNLTVVFDMRRTYYDLIIPFFYTNNQNANVQWPYLWDTLLKLSWDITPKDNLSFDAYGSLEGMNYYTYGDTNSPQNTANFSGNFEYQILNLIGSARYTHNFDSEDSFDVVAGVMPEFGYDRLNQSESISWDETFTQYLYQLSSDFYLNSIKGHKIQIGGIFIDANPIYGSANLNEYALTPQGVWTNYSDINTTINPMQSAYYGAYLMDNWEIVPSIILELGGREEYYTLNKGNEFSPQGGIKWESTKELDFYVRGGLYHEFPFNVYEVNSNTGNPDLKSQKVYHAMAGADYSDEDYSFRMEGFYKYYYDLNESDSIKNYNNNGIRTVYGGDIYLQKKQKKGDWLSGWISYTYVNGLEEVTNRSLEDPNNPYTTPLDQWFVPSYLRSHTISALAGMTYYKNPDNPSFFDFMNEWQFSVVLSAMSGAPYTPATNFISANVNGLTQYYFNYGDYDSAYTPWYFRLDLKLTIPVDVGWLKGLLGQYTRGFVYIELINALDWDNVTSYTYTVTNGQLTRKETKDWPIIPLAGFRVEF